MLLQDLYFDQLTKRLSAEKKFIPLFDRLNKAAKTDELKKLFAPSETFVKEHTERLSLLLQSHGLKKAINIGESDQYILERSGILIKKKVKDPLEKDILILEFAAIIYQLLLGQYEQVLQMAKVLEFETDVLLLEQTIKENKNNYGYLLQISANVVYVKIK